MLYDLIIWKPSLLVPTVPGLIFIGTIEGEIKRF